MTKPSDSKNPEKQIAKLKEEIVKLRETGVFKEDTIALLEDVGKHKDDISEMTKKAITILLSPYFEKYKTQLLATIRREVANLPNKYPNYRKDGSFLFATNEALAIIKEMGK